MKRALTFIAALALFGAGGTASVALADKPPAPPGQDPCSHGNTGKPCKPDPQPDRGKDCEKHGNKGGINEDHCAGETTQPPTNPPPTNPPPTTPPPTTPPPTTPPPSTTTTQTTTTPTTPAPTTPVATTPVTTTPAATAAPPAVVTQKKLETQLKEQEKKNGAPSSPPRADAPGELPNTGLPLGLVALLGGLLSGSGLWLRRKP